MTPGQRKRWFWLFTIEITVIAGLASWLLWSRTGSSLAFLAAAVAYLLGLVTLWTVAFRPDRSLGIAAQILAWTLGVIAVAWIVFVVLVLAL